MGIPPDFLQTEERCGYTVPASMKEVWAVQLELLQQLGQVCDRHGLMYFASGGTLIGAVRHGGYIPWDDDIDICMLRQDYDRLLEIAAEAFREPYFFQTAYTDARYSRGHAQLRDSRTTGILQHEAGKFPFHQGIFIDIFPLDGVPDDPADLAVLRRHARLCNRLLSLTVRYPTNPRKTAVKNVLHTLLSVVPYRVYYRWLEKVCTRYSQQPTHRVGALTFDADEDKFLFPRHCFRGTVRMPFEHLQIPVPVGFDEVLTIQYGEYRTMRRENSYHGSVLFDTRRSYTEYLAAEEEEP